MADVNKIKLPDKSTVNIKDYRIPGVDTTPTSGSDNVVTSDGIYDSLRTDNIKPIDTHIYENIVAASSINTLHPFMRVIPTNWDEPCVVTYRMRVYVSGHEDLYYSKHECEFAFFHESVLGYYTKNYIGNTSYRTIYFNSLMRCYAAYKTIGHLIGFNYYDAGNLYSRACSTSGYGRTFVIEILNLDNCTIEWLSSCDAVSASIVEGYVAGTSHYGITNYDGTTQGISISGDRNTNTIGYFIRYSGITLPVTAKTYRYRILFSNKERTAWIPSNTSTSTNATAQRDVNQTPIDPFGPIVYYSTTTALAANGLPGATNIWTQYTVTFGYSFNRTGAALTLTYPAPIYIKCAPQSDGTAIIDADTPYVQSLPTTNDGKIYIYIGNAYSATAMELTQDKPVYYHDGNRIRLWTDAERPVTSISALSTDIEYPSAKAVYDTINSSISTALTTATVWEAGTGENSVVVKGCEGVANGIYSTVEGYQSETGGTYTENTKEATEDSSAGSYAHAEGVCTIASGARGSHAEGRFTLASGGGAHAEGSRTVASGMIAHAEGNTTLASGDASHAEGYDTKSSNVTSHAEGLTTVSSGYASHAEGCCSKAIGSRSHAEGTMTKAYGSGSHAENGNWWIDITSITGSANTTSYVCTFSKVNKVNEIVELYETLGSTKFINLMKTASLCKSGYGQNTFMIAVTNVSNISLSNNILTCTFTLEKTLSETALSNASNYRISTNGSFGNFSHAENGGSAIGYDSHAEGSSSYSIGDESHAEGYVTLALNDYEHAQGTYNKSTKTSSTFGNAGNTIHSIGIGTSSARKNAEEIMQNGDMYLIGVGNYNGTNFSEAQTVQQVINGFNDIEEVASAALNDLNNRVTDLESQEIHTKLETSQPSGGFKPNTFYNLGTISGSVTFLLAAATDNTIVNHYYWTFETGSTAPTITWPSNITWVDNSNPNINSNKHYEVSILNGIGVYMEI